MQQKNEKRQDRKVTKKKKRETSRTSHTDRLVTSSDKSLKIPRKSGDFSRNFPSFDLSVADGGRPEDQEKKKEKKGKKEVAPRTARAGRGPFFNSDFGHFQSSNKPKGSDFQLPTFHFLEDTFERVESL